MERVDRELAAVGEAYEPRRDGSDRPLGDRDPGDAECVAVLRRQLAVGVRSPELDELAGVKLNGQLFDVFTIRGDRIVRVRDFAPRAEAQDAAGLHDLSGWR